MGCQPSKGMHEMASAPKALSNQPHDIAPIADIKLDSTSGITGAVASDNAALHSTSITTTSVTTHSSESDSAASHGEQPQSIVSSRDGEVDGHTHDLEGGDERLLRTDVADGDADITLEPSTSAPHFSIEVHAVTHIGFGPLKRENQDTFYVKENFSNREGQGLFCVFDGHGSKGRAVANFAQEQLPAMLSSLLDFSQNERASEVSTREAISQAFLGTHQALRESSIDTSVSGATASVVLLTGDGEVVVGSVGDSRVLLATRRPQKSVVATFATSTREEEEEEEEEARHKNSSNNNNNAPLLPLSAEPLSQDHRPGRPDERERVEAAGGRVQAKRTEHGVTVGEPRIWLKDIDMPGLLVSRALGDEIAASVGCSAEPEVTSRRIDARWDRYLIIASDGIWDVLNNQHVVDLCVDKSAKDACDAILQEALLEWEDRHLADNITIIIVKFNPVVDEAASSS